MKVYCLTNDNHLHLIEPFSYFWNKYTNNYPVTIVGFSSPDNIPFNCDFISLGPQLPAGKWSNGLIKLCNLIENDYFILMLEDYWLYSQSVMYYFDNFIPDGDILRYDLSGNRIGHKHNVINYIPGYAILESLQSAKYLMSFQAAIWNKSNLLKVLRPNESPWQSEIEGSKRVLPMRVLGTNPAVLNYQPVWRSGKRQWRFDKFSSQDRDYIIDWLKKYEKR